jgi:hypothetical protein
VLSSQQFIFDITGRLICLRYCKIHIWILCVTTTKVKLGNVRCLSASLYYHLENKQIVSCNFIIIIHSRTSQILDHLYKYEQMPTVYLLHHLVLLNNFLNFTFKAHESLGSVVTQYISFNWCTKWVFDLFLYQHQSLIPYEVLLIPRTFYRYRTRLKDMFWINCHHNVKTYIKTTA